MKTITIVLTVCLMVILTLSTGYSADITSAGSGNWSSTGTWVGDAVPLSTDNVIIADGHTVTIDGNVAAASITVGQGTSGILTFDGTTGRVVTVSGDVTVSAGGSFIVFQALTPTGDVTSGSNVVTNVSSTAGIAALWNISGTGIATGSTVTSFDASSITMSLAATLSGTAVPLTIQPSIADSLVIGGNLTNNGTFDMSLSTSTTVCNVMFNKVGDQTVSGSGTTTRFRGVYVSKSVKTNRVISSINVYTAAGSTLFISTGAGTWEQNAGTLTAGNSVTTGASTGLSITGSGSLNVISATLRPLGTLTVNTSGTVTVGGGSGNNLDLTNAGAIAQFQSGTVNINGKIAIASNSSTVSLTGANINVDCSYLGVADYGFRVTNAGTGFTFSAGTVTLLNPNPVLASQPEFNVAAGFTMTGTAKVVIGNGASAPSPNGGFRMGGAGLVNMKDLEINTGSSGSVLMQGSMTLSGTLTLTSGTLTIGAYTLTLQNPIAGTATNLSAGLTSDIAISGTAAGINIPSNITAFHNMTLNNINGTTLQGNLSLVGVFMLTAGNLALNGQTLSLGSSASAPGSLTYTAGSITGTGTFKRWFGTSAISGTAGLFPMGVGVNNRNLSLGGTPTTGGTVSVSYVDATTVSTPFGPSFNENAQTFVNRYNANWSVAVADGFAGSGLTLAINGNGIPGISAVGDLNVSGATGPAPGTYAAPAGTTSAPVVNRAGLTDGTLPSTYYIASTTTSPLPIQLASFTAQALSNQRVRLAWTTLSELNNFGFYIQKRPQGEFAWNEIPNCFVPGHGTTNEPQHYSFTDAIVTAGTWQYRLKQVDLDGSVHYSEVVQVDVLTSVKESAPIEFALHQNYPNPFNPSTEIKFSVEQAGLTTLKIYNLLGQEVATLFNGMAEAGQYYNLKLDATSLASGMYFYRLESGQKSDLKKMLLLK